LKAPGLVFAASSHRSTAGLRFKPCATLETTATGPLAENGP
jgi:hypothetical protein